MIAITMREDMPCRHPILLRKPRFPSWSRPEKTIGGVPAAAPRISLSATAVTKAANSHRSNGPLMLRRASSSAPASIQTDSPSVTARTRLCEDLSLSSLPGFSPLPLAQGCPGNWCNRLGLCKASPSPVAKQWERVPEGRVRALCLHSKCFSIPTCCAKEPSSGLRPPSPTRSVGEGETEKRSLTSQARFLSLGRRDSAHVTASAGISCRLIEFPRTALPLGARVKAHPTLDVCA